MPTAERTEYRVKLMPRQDRFVFSGAKFPAFVGGLGSGKPMAGAIRSYRYAALSDGLVVAPTFPMLRDSTQYTFFELLDKGGVPYTFNKADQEADLFGHRVLFRTAEHADRLRGPNLGWAWLDEAALMRRRVWDVVLGRLRVGDPSAWATTTPAGFNWVYDLWQTPGDQYELHTASTRENRYLPKGYVHDLEDAYSGEFAAQEIDGQFVAFEGLVYSEYRDAIHLIEDDPSERWHRVRSIDFGFTNPFVCLWGAIDEDGRLYVYDEHYERKTLIRDHAAAINARGGKYDWTVSDHDAQDAAELAQHGVLTVNARKDVTIGLQRVKARMKVKEDGRPRLYIHDRCVNLRRELGMYRWRGDNREEPVKENDHAMDALRYMVMGIDSGSGAVPKASRETRPVTAGMREDRW